MLPLHDAGAMRLTIDVLTTVVLVVHVPTAQSAVAVINFTTELLYTVSSVDCSTIKFKRRLAITTHRIKYSDKFIQCIQNGT